VGPGGAEDLVAYLQHGWRHFRLDESTVTHISSHPSVNQWRALPDDRFDNYLYDLGEQVSLLGRRFARRRTYLRAAARHGGELNCKPISLSDPKVVRQIRLVQHEWSEGRIASATVRAEDDALEACLRGCSVPNLRGVGVYMDDSLAAFAVYEIVGQQAIAYFVKGRRDGVVYASIWQSLFEDAYAAGAYTLNGGYHGGLAGLRMAKQGLRPQAMLKMYSLLAR
jgi:hypothetical protein